MSPTPTDDLRILLVEDNPGDARLFEHHLTAESGETFPAATATHVETLAAAMSALEADPYDLVLLDLGLPDSTGLDTLDCYNEEFDALADVEPIPVVVLTGLKDDAAAVEAIERGAQDYLVKDNVDSNVLHRTIRYALERHHQQQELRRQNERLERFASVVSHDLRNPLAVAMGRVEMIEDNDEHVSTIADNLDRMEAIIDDVLTLAREGRSVDETEAVDLAVLADDCWANVETCSASLSTDTVTIEADPNRCQQLLENLLRNSIEHVGEEVSIHIGRLPNGFYVEDDGPGIPPEDRDEVFNAGFTTNRNGTGFGLNIVKETAEAHGWSVSITDGSEGGARFEFTGVQIMD